MTLTPCCLHCCAHCQCWKVGPDFLDPLHHVAACGRESINLDGWMLNKQQVLDIFHRYSSGQHRSPHTRATECTPMLHPKLLAQEGTVKPDAHKCMGKVSSPGAVVPALIAGRLAQLDCLWGTVKQQACTACHRCSRYTLQSIIGQRLGTYIVA